MANIRISELDFDQIKLNLKTFLQSQDEFTDYDFEGSALSVLLDVLAYNTHYNAYLANMLANEMFLDSAVKRASAVSIAKHLGYTPASARGARAVLDITVNNPTGSPASLTLPRYTPFTTTINGSPYTFLNTEEYTIVPVGGVYTFEDVTVVEGTQLEINYNVVTPGPDEKYEIPNENIDTSTILVTVQNSSTDTTTEAYTLTTDITGLDGNSRVFYLEENPQGNYEVFFGDGILGKKLAAGNIVKIRYLVVSGSVANVSRNVLQTFTTSVIGGSANLNITTVTNSTSGTEKETLSSIKFNAPRVNSARNRAVTADDYQALISANYTDAESISVWGGEDNVPPIYGKVLISLKPFEGFTISDTTKQRIITEILNSKKVLAIQPEFVDPEYFYVKIVASVRYNAAVTTKTPGQLETIVRNTISQYFSTDLQKFNRDFNKSKLIKLILESDSAIDSVLLSLRLQKRFTLNLNSENSFIEDQAINFENGISPGTLTSSRFFTISGNATVLVSMSDLPSSMPPSDTGTGTIVLRNVNTGTLVNANIGTINYGTGIVELTGFTPTALPNNITDFRMTGDVQDDFYNIQVFRNQILILDTTTADAAVGREAGLLVNVLPVTE